MPNQDDGSQREVSVHDASDCRETNSRPDLTATSTGEGTATIVIIERRALNRECLARCLAAASGQDVLAFSTIEEWLQVRDTIPASIIVLATALGPRVTDVRTQLSHVMRLANGTHVIVLSDVEDPDQIIQALHAGVRGYIPTSLSLNVAIESIHLVRAGGTFVPAGSLIAARRTKNGSREIRSCGNGLFTERQAAVIKALRLGKPNKIIAYELNMSESTVKVHVRNIMKKLRAKNRTEVAFITNELFSGEPT